MTNCWRGCWIGFQDGYRSLKRTVTLAGRSQGRAHYNDARATVEFEYLIDDEDFEPEPRRVITDKEKDLIKQRKYDTLVEQQRKLDMEIDAKLKKDEDDLRLEEEAYYEAKREASRVARQAKKQQERNIPNTKKYKGNNSIHPDSISVSSWISDDGLSVDSAELDAEDFDSFLEKVKARSLLSSSKQVESLDATVSNGIVANGSWASSVAQSVEATKIAEKSYDAFKILDLLPPELDDRTTDVER